MSLYQLTLRTEAQQVCLLWPFPRGMGDLEILVSYLSGNTQDHLFCGTFLNSLASLRLGSGSPEPSKPPRVHIPRALVISATFGHHCLLRGWCQQAGSGTVKTWTLVCVSTMSCMALDLTWPGKKGKIKRTDRHTDTSTEKLRPDGLHAL